MKRSIIIAILIITFGISSNTIPAELDSRIEAYAARKREISDKFERARMLAEALKMMYQYEVEYNQLLKEEQLLINKLNEGAKSIKDGEK